MMMVVTMKHLAMRMFLVETVMRTKMMGENGEMVREGNEENQRQKQKQDAQGKK